MIDTNLSANELKQLSEMPRMFDIFLKHLPTKQGHNYNPVFERYFERYRLKRIKVLEIGVEAGTSLRMWKEYFPNAEIHGFDIDEACKAHEEDRIRVHIGDQRSEEDLLALPDNFDIIVDDGMHSVDSQINTFKILFQNKMKKQGIYAIEDIIGVGAKPVFQFFNTLGLCLNYWPAGLHGGAWSGLNDFNPHLEKEGINDPEIIYFTNNIVGVSTYRHLVVIDKGMNPTQGQAAFRLKYPEIQARVNEVRSEFLNNSTFTPTAKRFAKPKED